METRATTINNFKTIIFFEVDEILPKNVIPNNDSFTITIKHLKKTLTELFPIQNILSFEIDDLSKAAVFSVKISKGPMILFKSDFEISRLVFLNKESSDMKSLALLSYESNKKLISGLQNVSSLKVNLKYKVAYNEKEKMMIMKRLSIGNKFHKAWSKSKFNNKGLGYRTSDDVNFNNRETLLNADQLKFVNTPDKVYETSEIDKDIEEPDSDSSDEEKERIQTKENEKFSVLISDLTNAIANFANLPCTKFSTSIAEKFFKLHNKYYSIFKEYSSKYHKLRKLMNKYNEKHRLYTKMNYKLKNSLKLHEDKLNFQININNYERTSNVNQHNAMSKNLKFFEMLFENAVKEKDKPERQRQENDKDREINYSNKRNLDSKEKDNYGINSNSDTNQDFKTLKSILESISRRPEVLSKLQENKFNLLKSNAVNFGVKLEIPAEWIIDKIDEVPEHSILTSEKDELSQIKNF